jgi:hypothetical protein
MRFLTILFFLCAVQVLSAQTRFYKLYSGTGFDKGEDVLALPDSTFVVAGSSGSWEANAQGFLMKLDQQGNYVWSQAYGAQETEEIKRVFHRPGMGYYLAGMSNSWSGGDYDPMLIFTNLAGDQQWIKTFPHTGWERIHDGVMTADTGFVLVGERQAQLAGSADVLLLRLDKYGDTLWTKTIGTAGDDRANSILRVQDSLYVIGGEWYVADSSATKGFVLKINDQGTVLWMDTLGHLGGDFVVSDLTQTPFGIQFAGNHTFTTENHNVFSGSISLSGQIINQNAPQDGTFLSDDKCQQIAYLSQQDLSIFGIQVQNDSTFSEYYDLNFGFVDALFGYWLGLPYTMVINEGYDYVGNIKPTLDGGFVAVGMNSVIVDGQNQLNGGSNVFVLKVNGDGSAYVQTDTVFTTQQLVGLSPIFEGSQVLMFPNPVASVLHFNWEGSEAKLIEIHDVVGNLMHRETMSKAQTIVLDKWPQGVYYVRINGKSYPLVKH